MKTKETLKKGILNWLLKYFRPHIVEIDDYFYIRRFSILGYQYLGVSTLWWWSNSYKHNAEFSTLEKAENRFNERKEIRKREKEKNKEKIIKIL